MMKKFFVYLDDGKDVYKIAVPAKDENDARDYVKGNGDVIAVKDITEQYPISIDKIASALQNAGFGQTEMDLITRTLQNTRIAE